ncbi:MAG: hypothetical protein QOD06_674 [Candidatus Binatota bacterium]|nr:hypothetical protein [Candidatus Binatota bacterium]
MRLPRAFADACTAIVGACVAIAGSFIVAERRVAGHVLLLSGMALFAYGSRPRSACRPAVGSWGGSRPPLIGLSLLLLATAVAVLSISDSWVASLWLLGLFFLVASGMRSAWREAPASGPAGVLSLFAVAGLSAAVNLAWLTEFPWAVHGDLGEVALKAMDMNLTHDLFRPSDLWAIPGLFYGIQRLGLEVDPGLFGARLPDAVIGVITASFVFATVCELSGRRAALTTALLAAGSATLINTWRSGLGFAPPALLPLVAMWAFSRGLTSPARARDFFLIAGLAAGLGVQVYVPARIVPVMLAAWTVHELAFGSRESRRRVLRGFAWTTLCALAVAGPLLWEYSHDPQGLFARSERTLFSEEGMAHSLQIYGATSVGEVVWNQLVRSAGMFHLYETADAGSFLPNRGGFFEPLTAALFLLGLARAATCPRDRQCAWPVLGLLLAMSLEVLTVDPPIYSRAGPAAAMALVLVGFACAGAFTAIERVSAVAGAHADRRQGFADAAAIVLACSGLLLGLSRYFLEYCRKDWPLSNSTAVARRIAAEPVEDSFTYLLAMPAFSIGYGNIRFLARGHRGDDLPPGGAAPRLSSGVNLFIAVPGRTDELKSLARALPPGRWEEHYRAGTGDELEILVLRIVVGEPKTRDRRPSLERDAGRLQ